MQLVQVSGSIFLKKDIDVEFLNPGYAEYFMHHTSLVFI